jgi:lipid A ethanolaminephosphotransferase
MPLAIDMGIYYANGGFFSFPLPYQYNSAALGSLLAYKLGTQEMPKRLSVSWVPAKTQARQNIIMMMDESIRADYLDFRPGNRNTPHLPALASQFIDFGPAASGGDCSNYSNALLRFGASRKDLVNSVNTNATLFAYARKAGYRTVYIDAQAYHIAVGNKIQNFMTVAETAEIDAFYALTTRNFPMADYELTEVIAKELKSGQPVFIYANKNGAHFPYDGSYPSDQTPFHPTQAETGDSVLSRIASYRNVISWSVDKWMDDFFRKVDLSRTVMIYTGDHGQRLVPGKLTHCQTEAVDPRTGYVPLLVHAPAGALRDAFTAAVPLSKGRASHFQIAPTLYLLMGYSAADVERAYDESLFKGTSRPTEFTSGDVFGLFGSQIKMTHVDLLQDHLEPEAR